MADRTPKKIVSQPNVHVFRCCIDNVLERKHSIDLYGPKATKESVLALLERLTGFKCVINGGLSSKVCRSCYEKIMNFKKIQRYFFYGQQNNSSPYFGLKGARLEATVLHENLYLAVQVIRFCSYIIPIIYLLFVVIFCIWHGFLSLGVIC